MRFSVPGHPAKPYRLPIYKHRIEVLAKNPEIDCHHPITCCPKICHNVAIKSLHFYTVSTYLGEAFWNPDIFCGRAFVLSKWGVGEFFSKWFSSESLVSHYLERSAWGLARANRNKYIMDCEHAPYPLRWILKGRDDHRRRENPSCGAGSEWFSAR